jgi:uncharacterized protein YjbI with pentapeptide repeats
MKRVGTAILAVLMLMAVLTAGLAQGAPKPVRLSLSDPFWPLSEPRLGPTPAPGTVENGCPLIPGASCPGAELTPKGRVYELPGIDLSAANLRGAGLRMRINGASLAASDLTEADLNGTRAVALTAPFANFGKADVAGLTVPLGRLAGADLRGAETYEASFFGADLAGADLRGDSLGDELTGAVLSGADLRGANLSLANLQFADLTGAKLSPGALKRAYICDTVLPSGKVAGKRRVCQLPATYVGVGSPRPRIKPTDARYSLLRHAAGTGRNAAGQKCGVECGEGGEWLAKLRGRSFAYGHLFGTRRFEGRTVPLVNLTGANLAAADFSGTVMPGAAASFADFQAADVEGADLTYAELAGANLKVANLTGVDARDADLTRADLEGADLDGARLGATSLVEADLHGATFAGTDLSGADLFGAEVDPGALTAATLCDTVLPDGTVASPAAGCEHR